jgi:NADH-quinone oxidoreductase subunit L
MGGLKKKMPITFWTFTVGFLAIAGIPGFSGFFSKDEILVMALTNPGNGPWLYGIGLITALLTAFYMTRMLVLVFIVEPAKEEAHDHAHAKKKKHHVEDGHEEEHHEVHESPGVMTIPLIILAFCSFAAGYIGLPHVLSHEHARLFQDFVERFVAKTAGHAHLSVETEYILMGMTTTLILASMGLAYYIYVKNDHVKMRDSLREKFNTLWTISSKKFKVDEFYELAIIKPLYSAGGFLVNIVETHVINGFIKVLTKVTTGSGQFLDDNKPERLEMGILYIVIGLTVVLVAIFNAFIFR